MTNRTTTWMLLLACTAGASVGCKRLEPPSSRDQQPPSLSVPAPGPSSGAAASPAKGEVPGPPALAAPAADEDDDDAVAPPSAGGRRASAATAAGRHRRARDGSNHPSEPASGAGDPHTGPADPYETDLKVTRLVVSKGISGREPVGASSSFKSSDVDRLYAFVELANDSRTKDEIYVTFAPVGGGPQHRVKLEVGSEPRWRTWAFTRRPKSPGAWTAVVKTSSGRVLASTSFEVKP